MPAKRLYNKRDTKSKNSIWFIVTFLIILFVAIILGYFLSNRKQQAGEGDKQSVKTTEKIVEKNKTKNPLSGTWVSEYDGAIMDIKGDTFTLEVPSVSNGTVISGKISVQNKKVLLIYTSGSQTCKQKEGRYIFEFNNKKLKFKLLTDECKSRADRMSVAWFRL